MQGKRKNALHAAAQATRRGRLRVETEFAQLDDGTLVETIEDPKNAAGSLLAVYKDGKMRYEKTFRTSGRVLVPLSRSGEILRHVRFARGVKPYVSPLDIFSQIGALLHVCLDVEMGLLHLMSAFVVSTWFIDKLPIAPYLALVGLPRSGKTTAMRVLSLLCRRSLLTADISSAAFYQVYEKLTPTLLVDETLTAGDKRALFHLLRSGSTPGFLAFRKDRSFNAFGAKVVSWTVLPDDAALNSRCIIIPMFESGRTGLLKPTDPQIVAAAEDIQNMLLQYRLVNYNALSLPKVLGDQSLRSRPRDLYEALALPFGEDATICQGLAERLADQRELNREPLPLITSVLLRILYQYIHLHSLIAECRNKDLSKQVNESLESLNEPSRVTPHKVGRILTSLGFEPRERRNSGYTLEIDLRTRRQIHQLARNHGIGEFVHGCDICNEFRSASPTIGTQVANELNQERGKNPA